MTQEGLLVPDGLTVPLLLQRQVLLLAPGHQLRDVILHGLPQGQHHLHQLGVDATVSEGQVPHLAIGHGGHV